MKTEIFNYNGNPVTFQLESGEVMVSATEMAAKFNKQPSDWSRLKSTSEFIASLSAVRGIPRTELIQINQGGNGQQGTWMHEDVALEFARWLSPHFAIWCNSKIKELLKSGVATVSDDDEVLAKAIEVLQKRVQQKAIENQELENKLSIVAPKVEYYDEVLMCEGCFLITHIAKELGLSGEKLNSLLNEMKIQYNCRGVWVLYAKYQGKEYTRTHTYTYDKNDGTKGSRMTTVWTEKGREFIHKLINKLRECGDLIE